MIVALPYADWLRDALREVARKALARFQEHGPIEGQALQIAFEADYPGVVLSLSTRQKYPKLMTIILEHQYENLNFDFDTDLFSVTLWFVGRSERITVPWAAVVGLVDEPAGVKLTFANDAISGVGFVVDPLHRYRRSHAGGE